MKTKLLFFFALICSIGLTGCSKDDNPGLPIEKELAGTYKGEFRHYDVNGHLSTIAPRNISISKSASGEDQLAFEVKNFMFNWVMADILIGPCRVEENNGSYSFSGSQTLTRAESPTDYVLTIQGAIKSGKINIEITAKPTTLGSTISPTSIKYEGVKLIGTESSEAKITAYNFENAIVTKQPVIDEANKTITFQVSYDATDDDLKALIPTITASDKAVVTPASGVAVDFSGGRSANHMVIAEDGTVVTYKVVCKKDDEPALPIEKEMAGAYKGMLEITMNGQLYSGGIPQKLYISQSASGGNQLSLQMKDLMFNSMNLGDVLLDPCGVKEKNGTYQFSKTQTVTFVQPIGTCTVTMEGTIDKGQISVQMTIPVQALGQKAVITFKGTRLSGNESSEAKITAFSFEDNIEMEPPVIDHAKGTITCKAVDVMDDDLKALTPVITISDKAAIAPAGGIVQDFSGGKTVTYTVVAEDGTVKTYAASIAIRN